MGIIALSLTSCTVTRKTATSIDVVNTLASEGEVDLEVSQTRATYVLHTTAAMRRGGNQNLYNTAVRELLRQHHAEVLVAPEFDTRVRRRLLRGSKVTEVTVYGYPAKYKNFRVK